MLGEPQLEFASAARFYERFAIDPAALTEARAWLVAEIQAFDRPVADSGPREARFVPAERLGDGSMSDFPIYAATRLPPVQPLDAYWSAVVRYDADLIVGANTQPTPSHDALHLVPVGASWGDAIADSGRARLARGEELRSGRTYASVLGLAQLGASRVLSELAARLGTTPPTDEAAAVANIQQLLGSFRPHGVSGDSPASDTEFLGHAAFCGWNNAADTGYAFMLSLPPAFAAEGDLHIVRGYEGLECAVRGTIDGTPCAVEDIDGEGVDDLMAHVSAQNPLVDTPTWNAGGELPSRVDGSSMIVPGEFQGFVLAASGTGTEHLYVVRSRGGSARPGGWEPVVGFVGEAWPSGGSPYGCTTTMISGDLDRRVANLVGISDTDPGRSRVDCAGLPWDLQLPLENELTDDGNGVESSWRHYLETARAAAAEADMLGEELVRAGTESDARAEAQADELERLCGVRINVTSIGASAPLRVMPLPTPPTASCAAGYVKDEAAGACILDLLAWAQASGAVSSADASRLAECIGSGATVDWVALGDKPVCLWEHEGEICGQPGTLECPRVSFGGARTPEDCQGAMGEYKPSAARSIVTEAQLNLFVVPEPRGGGGRPTADPWPCTALARLRAYNDRGGAAYAGTPHDLESDRDAVLESNLTDGIEFRRLSRQLGWVPSAGAYSRVTYAGTTMASTGYYGATSADFQTWPAGRRINGVDVFDAGLCTHRTSTGMAIGASDPLHLTDGIFCLRDVPVAAASSTAGPRARANDLLGRAVIAARVVGGVSLAENRRVFLPYYPYNVHRARLRDEGGVISESETGTNFWEASIGSVQVDDNTFDSIGYEEAGNFSDIGARTERVSTSSWDEWVTCRYDDTTEPCRHFDSGHSARDASGEYAPWWDTHPGTDDQPQHYGLPLVILPAGEQVRVAGSEEESAANFGRRGTLAALVNSLATRGVEPGSPGIFGREVRPLTDYFRARIPLQWDSNDCTAHHRGCTERHGGAVDFRIMPQGNAAFVGNPAGLTNNDILNGMEMVCAAARIDAELPFASRCSDPPTVTSLRDLLQAQAYLQCRADEIDAQAGATVMRNLPQAAIDSMRSRGGRVAGEGEGQIASDVATLSLAFEDIYLARTAISGHVRGIGAEIRELRSAVGLSEIAHEIEDLNLQSTIFNQVTTCVLAAIPDSTESAGWAAANGAAACINSVAQIAISSMISGLQHDAERLRLESTFASFDLSVNGHMQGMSQAASRIRSAIAQIDAALSRLNGARSEARRALARALYLESEGAQAHFAVSSVYRARYNTVLTRYQNAHERAIRQAYIARRATEQRLGMSLETMTAELITVDAPSTWADQVCTLTPIDYERVRGTTTFLADGGVDSTAGYDERGYSREYVGDYVDRLEQVFYSYGFAFPFADGTDTAVVSIRDDIYRSMAECEVPSPNLLYRSNDLRTASSAAAPGWDVIEGGCDTSGLFPPAIDEYGELETDSPFDAGCVNVRALTGTSPAPGMSATGDEVPVLGAGSDLGRPTAFRVSFLNNGATTPTIGIAQVVSLRAGRYRLSWYGRQVDVGTSTTVIAMDPKRAVTVSGAGVTLLGSATATVSTQPVVHAIAGTVWSRYHLFFDVDFDGEVAVTLTPAFDSGIQERVVDLAGLMLEDVAGVVVGDVDRSVPSLVNPAVDTQVAIQAGPMPFFETGDTLTRVVRACPDRTGEEFRRTAWTRGCANVCPDGYDRECDPRVRQYRCYQQTTIPISSRFLDAALTGTPTGFAAGNYNYRIENVGVNVVGTGIRDCSSSTSGCYGSGNVSYSLLHTGSFDVVNARGETYQAPLFSGRIEGARALASERYITNPISSADQALITPSTRPDFQGRPLGGTLILRIWDEPTVDFTKVEDVQIVLGYRYWQHQR